MIPKVKEHDTFGCLLAGVPGRECPESARDKATLGQAEQETGCNERSIAALKRLEGADNPEEEELESEPLAGPNAIENYVGGNFKQDDAQ